MLIFIMNKYYIKKIIFYINKIKTLINTLMKYLKYNFLFNFFTNKEINFKCLI